jgi:hypothetical protein
MNETVPAHTEKSLRLKTWNESGIEEKLDVMRGHIKVLTHRLAEAEALIAKLRYHQHSASGEIVVYLDRLGNRIEPYELRLPTGLR